jgi:hypothetical protein
MRAQAVAARKWLPAVAPERTSDFLDTPFIASAAIKVSEG